MAPASITMELSIRRKRKKLVCVGTLSLQIQAVTYLWMEDSTITAGISNVEVYMDLKIIFYVNNAHIWPVKDFRLLNLINSIRLIK